ncbi:MAG TPA: Gldg family protein [Candidatus Ornithomonoglobus merdipullorum]|uniref:Gldg family protein n=1 Tax=Candidatus Ornithomonoglobus merdipullorum TaxID=2840895 RepID=A0A9D1MAC5_9FIRM|nr:Gldg family protein [Candidatus Ornithomonoglobus merdipullorum]
MNKKYKMMSWAGVAIAVALLVLVNLFMSVLAEKTQIKIDLTSNKLYELTDESYEYLDTYTADTVIYILASEDEQDDDVRAILDRYAAANSHIKIENVDVERNPSFGREYVEGGRILTVNSIIVVSGDRSRIIELPEIKEEENGITTQLNVESKITSALKYVSSDTVINAYFTTGHNELELEGAKSALESENYTVADIATMTEDIPEDADLLILPRPMMDFTTAEIAKINAFVEAGGALQVYLNVECTGLTNLYSYLNTVGIIVNDNEIFESSSNAVASEGMPYLFLLNYVKNDVTEDIISKERISVYLPFAKSLDALYETSGAVTVSPYLTSSDDSYTTTNFSQPTRDTATYEGESNIALMSKNGDTGGKIYVSGTDMLLSYPVEYVNGMGIANIEYFTTLSNDMTGNGETFVVPVKNVDGEAITMSITAVGILFIVIVILVPAVALTLGIVIFFKRKNM